MTFSNQRYPLFVAAFGNSCPLIACSNPSDKALPWSVCLFDVLLSWQQASVGWDVFLFIPFSTFFHVLRSY